MRTFAMTLVGAACFTVAAVLVYFFVRVVLPALSTDATAAAFIPVFACFVGLFIVLGGVSLLWPGARTRAPFWLASAASGLLFLAMFGVEIAFSLSHPSVSSGFVPASLAATAAVIIVIGGFAAFFEVRRHATIWSSDKRAGWLISCLGGVILGASLTSWIAGSESADGGRVSGAPTATAVVVAEQTRFDTSNLSVESGKTLGLVLVNRDPAAHSFDIDGLGIHVQMPPDSATIVTIAAAAPGTYEFYCALLGHRDAGMAGTLTIQQDAAEGELLGKSLK